MPYRVEWYIPQQIVYAQLKGDLKTKQAIEVIRKLAEHAQSSPRKRVHYVVDMLKLQGSPLNLPRLQEANKRHQSSNADWSLLVTTNGIYKAGAQMASLVLQQRLRVFDTVAGALAFLRADDPDLDWSQANTSVLPQG